MTEGEPVQKLHDMREHGRSLGRCETAMMLVFGLIFDDEIARQAARTQLASHGLYEAKYGRRIGAGEDISDGRKLNRFVTVNADEIRRWRP